MLFVGTGVLDGPAWYKKELLCIVIMIPDRSFAFAQDDKKIITGRELFPPCCGNIVVNMTIPE